MTRKASRKPKAPNCKAPDCKANDCKGDDPLDFANCRLDPSWKLSHSSDERHIRAQRQYCVERHLGYEVFARIMGFFGVWEKCVVQRCRRQRRCAGNKRATTGFASGLYRVHPPCFFQFRDAISAEIYQPLIAEAHFCGRL